MIMSSKQKKIKFKPRIKLNHNKYTHHNTIENKKKVSAILTRKSPNN